MNKMPAGPSAYCDIDDTLVSWQKPSKATEKDSVIVKCRGFEEKVYINKHNLNFIKKLANRGHCVVLWSAGGVCWAEAVAKALKIEKYVWAVMSKPTYYVDDAPDSKNWIGKHRFIDFDGNMCYDHGGMVSYNKTEE